MVVVQFSLIPKICLQGMRKTTKRISVRIVGVSTEIRTVHLANTDQKLHRLSQLLRFMCSYGKDKDIPVSGHGGP
jgi:acetolactate synthase small subunit